MSKTTPEEAIRLALDALNESVDLVANELEEYKNLYSRYPSRAARMASMQEGLDNHRKAIERLAALIDEVRGVDVEPVAWINAEDLVRMRMAGRGGIVWPHEQKGAETALYTRPAPSQPAAPAPKTLETMAAEAAIEQDPELAAPVELPVVGDAVLKFLDELGDDAAVHIWPEDLDKCCLSECAVEVYSVRMGRSDGVKTIPLFSREQVDAAIAAGRKAS